MVQSTAAEDKVVAAAQTMQEFATAMKVVNPALAESVESKALVASKTPWAVAVATGLAIVSTKYGLGWDDTFTQVLSGGVVLVVTWLTSAVMRYLSPQYISGIFSKPKG